MRNGCNVHLVHFFYRIDNLDKAVSNLTDAPAFSIFIKKSIKQAVNTLFNVCLWLIYRALLVYKVSQSDRHMYVWMLVCFCCNLHLTHISIAYFLWDIGRQCRPRYDAKCGV